MKIEADDKEIQDIFSLGYFRIPRFQRPYSWDMDEVDSFWSDIVNEKGDSYFIGSMVVYQSKKPYFGIVDGQQRLTTITLLLSAIRNGFLRLGEENLAKGVHKYIEKPNIDNEDEFVLNSETAFPYLQDHIQSYDGYKIDCEVGVEEQKLEKAFDLLSERVSAFVPELLKNESAQGSLFGSSEAAVIKLKKLRDKLLSLKLVFIQLDNEEDAYLIFETLNARGRDLTTSDLIKNLILKKLKARNSILDQAKESWNSLVRQFDDSSDPKILDTFLLHYWLSKHGHTTDKKLFSEVKSYIGDDELLARELVADLSESASIYGKIVDPKSATWKNEQREIKEYLVALNSFRVRQHSPMTLALLRAYYKDVISLKVLKSSVGRIVAFHYCFNTITSQRSSGIVSTNYSRIAVALSSSKDSAQAQAPINLLKEFLRSKLPDESEFLIKFKDLEYLANRSKYRAAIVYALSNLIRSDSGGLPIDHESLSVEHIIPQSAIRSGYNEDVVGSIGNLLLIDQKTNSEVLRDLDPSQKLQKLSEMSFPLKSNFIKEFFWDESLVKERTSLIAKYIYDEMHDRVFKN